MNCPWITIITPTIQRESLKAACESLDRQTFTDWEHIVSIDCQPKDLKDDLLFSLRHPGRWFSCCGQHHNNGGNSCRSRMWERARGEWVFYLDDDNVLADDRVLEDLHSALEGVTEQWALFPIIRLGERFYNDPPGHCRSDTMNMVLRREVAQWPETTAYGSDGVLIDELLGKGIKYAAFPDFRPIAVIPKISFCK